MSAFCAFHRFARELWLTIHCPCIGRYGDSDSKLVIKENSLLHVATGDGSVAHLSDKRNGASMEILSGGRLYADGLFWVDKGGSADPAIETGVSMLVSGEGSCFENTAGIYLGSAGHYGTKVKFTDHAIGKIGGLISIGYSRNVGGDVFTLEDGATVSCSSVAIGHGSSTHTVPNRIEVLDGASLTVSGDLDVGKAASTQLNELFVSNATVICYRFFVGTGDLATRNRAVFFGPQTHFEVRQVGSRNLFGNTASGNELIFDGATWEHNGSSIYMSLGANAGNLIRVTNGGAIRSDKKFFIGYSNDYSNRVEVLNGGKIELSGAVIQLNHKRQELVVSNGTLICSYLAFGDSMASVGNRFELKGENAVFTETGRGGGTYRIFGAGSEGEYIVSDGAVWTYPDNGVYTSIGNGLTNNTVRIARGGRFNVAKGLFIGYKGDQGNGFSVEDGGFLDCKSLSVGADSQWLYISNSTVTVTNDCQLGFAQGGCTNRKCRIEFAGRSPKMDVGTYMTMDRTAELKFNVPEDGFAAVPLVIGGKLNVNASCRILVDAEAFRNGIARKAKVPLVSFAGADEISATALAESNALLGEGLSLTVEDKQIVLNAKRDRGFRLILR